MGKLKFIKITGCGQHYMTLTLYFFVVTLQTSDPLKNVLLKNKNKKQNQDKNTDFFTISDQITF